MVLTWEYTPEYRADFSPFFYSRLKRFSQTQALTVFVEACDSAKLPPHVRADRFWYWSYEEVEDCVRDQLRLDAAERP